MNDLSGLSGAPLSYPQKLDVARDQVLFVHLDEAAYRAASFLDDRVLAAGMQAAWEPWHAVEDAMSGAQDLRPLHFIFHTGHVGSTLLSRLIDETGVVLGLREPLPLRTLAEMADAGSPRFDPKLAVFLKLWSRGFASTKAVVLKATSSSGRIAPRLLDASAASNAVYLNLRAEPYLATLLAGANAGVDLRGFEAERAGRVRAAVGEMPYPTSIGELAAMSWLAESLAQQAALRTQGSRVLPVDFENLLGDVAGTLARVLDHFGIAATSAYRAGIARSAVLTRYSKAPQQYEYSPQFRARLLAQARTEHAGEIRRGLLWLDTVAGKNADAAALL